MDRGIYSPLKIFHHRDHIDALREDHHVAPIHVQVVPTNRCQQNCHFCAYRTKGYSSAQEFKQRSEIPADRLLALADECASLGVKAVEITGGGEPTLHEALPEFCRKLLAHGIEYGIVSNGMSVHYDTMKAMSSAAWVRFSIDAGSSQTYGAIRNVHHDVYDRVTENVGRLVAAKKQDPDPSAVIVGIGFVVTHENWWEVLSAATHARDLGVDNFRISAVFQDGNDDYFAPFHLQTRELCHQAKQLESGGFAVFDLLGDRLEDLAARSPVNPYCPLQRLCTYVGADQSVYRCCVLSYNKAGELFSVENQTLGEGWMDEKTAAKIRSFDARTCPRCMFNKKNETIRYALKTDSSHANFL